jgi:hypothetical protein
MIRTIESVQPSGSIAVDAGTPPRSDSRQVLAGDVAVAIGDEPHTPLAPRESSDCSRRGVELFGEEFERLIVSAVLVDRHHLLMFTTHCDSCRADRSNSSAT